MTTTSNLWAIMRLTLFQRATRPCRHRDAADEAETPTPVLAELLDFPRCLDQPVRSVHSRARGRTGAASRSAPSAARVRDRREACRQAAACRTPRAWTAPAIVLRARRAAAFRARAPYRASARRALSV